LLLPLALAVVLLAAWFARAITIETPILDVTLPKAALIASVPVLILARPWQLLRRVDLVPVALLAVFAGWLLVAGSIRGDWLDLKRTIGALAFGGLALALTWAGMRARDDLGSRLLATFFVAFTMISFAGSALELLTVSYGSADPLRPLWELFRPQSQTIDERLGVTFPPLPLHIFGQDRLLRVAGFSWHANILALSMLIPAAFSAILLWLSVRSRRTRMAAGATVLLGLSSAIVVWTHSRAGLLGLAGVLLAATVFTVLSDRRARRRLAALAPLVVGGALLIGLLALDSAGLQRIVGSIVRTEPTGPATTTVEEAGELADLRIAMVRAGLTLLTESPMAMLIGPGFGTYTSAVHDPDGPLYIELAYGTPDPGSYWLSVALAGGIPGAILMLGAFAVIWWRLIQRWREGELDPQTRPAGWRLVHLGWLIVVIPVWVVVQNAGGQPLEVPEAIPLGFLLATGLAFTVRRDE
jgi:hypothetical protein